MHYGLFASALAIGLGIAVPAAAEGSSQKGAADTIVVTGNRDTDRQIRDFVGALTRAPLQQQLSRFEWNVCPAAAGLPEGQKAAVVKRMRQVAQATRIPLDKVTCTPNVVVAVTHDKKAFLKALRRKHPDYFDEISFFQVRRLMQEPGPAVAWHIPAPHLDADGVAIGEDAEFGVPTNRTVRSPSRITPPTRPHFLAAVVVVETKALEGLDATQLADYAAMRAFAQTDPSQLPDPSPPTILTILEAPMGSEIPLTLTKWDLGFLRALYASPENLYAGAQRSDMKRRLKKELQEPKYRQD
jgi:hypothetical protein